MKLSKLLNESSKVEVLQKTFFGKSNDNKNAISVFLAHPNDKDYKEILKQLELAEKWLNEVYEFSRRTKHPDDDEYGMLDYLESKANIFRCPSIKQYIDEIRKNIESLYKRDIKTAQKQMKDGIFINYDNTYKKINQPIAQLNTDIRTVIEDKNFKKAIEKQVRTKLKLDKMYTTRNYTKEDVDKKNKQLELERLAMDDTPF